MRREHTATLHAITAALHNNQNLYLTMIKDSPADAGWPVNHERPFVFIPQGDGSSVSAGSSQSEQRSDKHDYNEVL